jgi:hypothetical protein
MSTGRLAVGILCVVLALGTCRAAGAQDVKPPSEVSVHQADPPADRALFDQQQSTAAPLANSQGDGFGRCLPWRPSMASPRADFR